MNRIWETGQELTLHNPTLHLNDENVVRFQKVPLDEKEPLKEREMVYSDDEFDSEDDELNEQTLVRRNLDISCF